MGGELEFPEAIIQSIQSLLTEREAARTTILSKSWHRAWLTLPNLVLDDSRFEFGFCEYAKETLKRYQQSNLKIERLKLLVAKYCSCDIDEKLIVKALTELGDNLVELSVEGCGIKNLDGIAIKCCRLESLCLDGVVIRRDALHNLFSSCPLIEKLSLFNSHSFGEERGLINTHLERLKCLVLCYESFKAFFPGDLFSKLPFLKDFTLNLKHSCLERREGGLDVQISNCSLEHIKIVLDDDKNRRRWRRSEDDSLKVRLDVPNIRKFTLEGNGSLIPELCFVSSSSTREWESHVCVENYWSFVCVSWFHELNTFLAQLRESKIHLSVFVESMYECCDYRIGDLSVTRKLELESLTIDLTGLPSFTCNALLDGLFRLCRPKLITHEIRKKEEGVSEWKENVDLLWHAFEQGMLVSIPGQLMYGLKGLEEVSAQVEDDVWRPLFFEEQADQQQQQRIRFLLKWKPS